MPFRSGHVTTVAVGAGTMLQHDLERARYCHLRRLAPITGWPQTANWANSGPIDYHAVRISPVSEARFHCYRQAVYFSYCCRNPSKENFSSLPRKVLFMV